MPQIHLRLFVCLSLLGCYLVSNPIYSAEPTFVLKLSRQHEVLPDSGRFHRLAATANWEAGQTAVIVSDMWDSHHCLNAVRRVQQLAPQINSFVSSIRNSGGLVIHAPSSCMDFYKDHPARQRATSIKSADNTPKDITAWCHHIATEPNDNYPIDQSGSAEDDDPQEHQQWHATLSAAGRNSMQPWTRQTSSIFIDDRTDFISESGSEIWNVLQSHKIQNVLLVGVHTNMCVLGRPFGLRQLTQHGFNAALVRDLTDTMYAPQAWPYVNHFSGTDLIVDYIERYICPTISSEQILVGKQFRFKEDQRRHIAILIAEPEYETNRTLSQFARTFLYKDFRVSLIYGPEPSAAANPLDGIPGLDAITDADVLLVSVRRKPLPSDQLQIVRAFVEAAKPVLGIRTASHAFSLRNAAAPAGLVSWPEFDATVFGGNYTNHYDNETPIEITVKDNFMSNELASFFTSAGTLYKTSPLAAGTRTLFNGNIANEPTEPIAWTYIRADGGRSFYTSLGHPTDFDNPIFRNLLLNSIRWSVDLPFVTMEQSKSQAEQFNAGRGRQSD